MNQELNLMINKFIRFLNNSRALLLIILITVVPVIVNIIDGTLHFTINKLIILIFVNSLATVIVYIIYFFLSNFKK